MLFTNTDWFQYTFNDARHPKQALRFRTNCHRQTFHNENLDRNALLLSSSSQLFRGAFVRYMHRIRSLLSRFSIMHRLAFIALFLSVLLAIVFSMVVSLFSRESNSFFGGKLTYQDPRHDMPHPSRPYSLQSGHKEKPMVGQAKKRLSPSGHYSMKREGFLAARTEIVALNNNTGKHFEDELVKTETNLTSLPHTSWYYQKDIHDFRPSNRANGVRLVSLNNACYCTRRNKLILPRRIRKKGTKHHSSERFPSFIYRFGVAQAVSWNAPKNILAFPSQKAVHITGITILWRGRTLNSVHAHLHRSLIPVRSLIDILRKSKFQEIKLAAESFDPPDRNRDVTQIQKYYLGDIPAQNRISLALLRPRLVCFRRVIALGSEYENRASSIQSYEHIKDLISREESRFLERPLIKFCAAKDANTHTLWIMNRQIVTSSFGVIENLAEVETLINHELINMHLTNKVAVRIIQAPNLKCPTGTALEGCYNLDCNNIDGFDSECLHTRSLVHEVQTFNNMTFLITTSGPADEGFLHMPRGSQVIELTPYGFLDRSYQQAAEDARLSYHRVEDDETREWEQEMYERFGDIARSRQLCWEDLECRAARVSRATHANIHRLRIILKKALFVWRTACAGEML